MAMGMGAPPMARPTGVTILAVLGYLGAGVLALIGVAFLMGGAFFGTMMEGMWGMGASFFAAMGVLIAFVLFFIAALYALMAWGFWAGKSWAWVLGLVLSGLSALGALGSLATRDYTAIVNIAISGFIIWYLLQPGVKAWFGRV